MSDIKELQNKKKSIILNLDESSLESYILSLTNQYYVYLIKSDVIGLNNVIDTLKYIVNLYEVKHEDIGEFISFCLLLSSNAVLKKVFRIDCELWCPEKKSLSSKGYSSAFFSIEKSRKFHINEKCNVKELYDMIVSDEAIDDKIVEKVGELYNAYKIFDIGD